MQLCRMIVADVEFCIMYTSLSGSEACKSLYLTVGRNEAQKLRGVPILCVGLGRLSCHAIAR